MQKKMRAFFNRAAMLLMTVLLFLNGPTGVSAASPYVHDPMQNPKAAKDILPDPEAVYGYRINPESERLKDFTDYDLTDSELVAKLRQKREEYHKSLQSIYDLIADMKAKGKSIEEIARAASTLRNQLRLDAYKDDPEGLAKVKKSNLENYGNENGGTPDFFYEQYGSWETVLEKSLSTNEGADAVLGLYDKYYDTYIIEVTVYTVVSGDSLYFIARQLWGDGNRWPVLYELNKDQLRDPNLIYPGQVLKIRQI